MEDIIYINFIGIYEESFLTVINDKIIITINYLNNITVFEYSYNIHYNINNTVNYNKYFIKIPKILNDNLKTSNFTLNLPKYYYFKYGCYNKDKNKSIIIYKTYNYVPLIYLGLPNSKFERFFQINYNYNQINENILTDCSGNIINYVCDCDLDCSGNYDGADLCQITLFNNYFGNDNYLLNTLKLRGDIYQICISNNNGIISYDNNVPINYKLFKIKNNIDIDFKTNIYFYDDTNSNLLSYIIYLNTYNFSPIKNLPLEYENIIVCINYISDSIDLSGTVYNSILSLNMQTFNPNQLCEIKNDSSGNFYYNTLFFFNYINPNYIVDSINIFSYDNDKYFMNTKSIPEFYNINYYQFSLYEYIIESDLNLSYPTILDISKPYLFMNLDLINFGTKLIRPEFANNYFYELTKSNGINFDILVKYIINFTFKKYNIFKLINVRFTEYDTKKRQNIVKNDLYINQVLHNVTYLYRNPNEFINFNNNIVNCIKCKIIFYYSSNNNIQINGYYTLDAKLFLNNYNLELYHKNYDINNVSGDEQKNKLLNMLLFLQTTTHQIKLYFYNKKNSVVPALYIYNQVDLFKNYNDFNTQIDMDILNNTYTEGYLKLNILINKEYYILFLYSDSNSFLNTSNFDELIFFNNNILFKILKINEPNGNLFENKVLFYICFQNLKDLNIFMEFIKSGIMKTNYYSKLSNYFNIPKSVTFYNYYNLNNYWVTNNESIVNKYQINFSINNLSVNQIYLYGDLFIECI